MSDNRKRRRDSPSGERSEEWVTFRLLCPVIKSGHIIGKGGEIVKKIRADTGATVRIDDPMRGEAERVVTISSRDQPDDEFCPAQDALFMVVEKLFEDQAGSDEEVQLRVLIDHSQVGGVIGKGGCNIKEMRDQSGANIKVFNNDNLKPACATPYEDLLQITGAFAEALQGCKLASQRLRQTPTKLAPSGPVLDMRGPPHMVPAPPRRPPPILDSAEMPPPAHEVDTEFRLLVPESHVGSIIGRGGKVVKAIREDTRAQVVVREAPENGTERIIECRSHEPAEARFVPAIEGVLAVLNCIFGEEQRNPMERPCVRMLLANNQVGAVLGKGGSTIKRIRQETGTQVVLQPRETLPGGREGDEVLQIEGAPEACMNAVKIVTLALRNNMIRTQGPRGDGGPGRRYDAPPGMLPPHMSGMGPMMAPPPGFGPPHMGPPPRGMGGGVASIETELNMKLTEQDVTVLLDNHGANINQVRKMSGARVKLHTMRTPDGKRELQICGTLDQARSAQDLVLQVLSGNNLAF